MYIFLRNCYLRNVRSNELVRSRTQRKFNSFINNSSSRRPIKKSSDFSLLQRIPNNTFTYNPLLHSDEIPDNLIFVRHLSITSYRADKEPLKPSSKVECTVQALKDEQNKQVEKKPVKKSWKQRIVDELMHYYHGFRLLAIDIKISSGLALRILRGKTLTRREHNLLVRTVGDLFRLVPFSVFIIVPFLEFTLPIFIKFFPNMLPSTFQTAKEREDKLKAHLKVKLEMAKFLQKTLDDMAVQSKDRSSSSAKEFAEWFKKLRTSGEEVTNEEILKFSKMFKDELTLDSLTRGQLVALCRILEVYTLGTNNLLRFQIRMKLRSLAADDKLIQKEGVDSLNITELQNACKSRGMRAYGLQEEQLRRQLSKWLDLSLNQKIPPVLLLLSRAMMLPETIPTTDKLKATISSLPDEICTQTSAAICEEEGKIDNKMKLHLIKEEARRVKEERLEQREERKRQEREERECLEDKAPIIEDNLKPMDDKKADTPISSKDIECLEDALDCVAKDKLIVEKECIDDLKEELADYQEDVQELKEVTCNKPVVKESKAAKRLFNSVNKMIQKMDCVVAELENKEKQMKKDLAEGESKVTQEDIVKIDELLDAIKKVQKVPNEQVLKQIKKMLGKMDDDHDGSVKVEDVLKVIELIGKDNVQLNTKQVDDIIELIDKEEILEVEDKIEKALQKNEEQKSKLKDAKKAKAESCDEECEETKECEQKSDCETDKPKMKLSTNLPPIPPTITDSKKGDSSKTV